MSEILYSDLYNKVLIEPFADNRANKLCIVSGYGSAAMAFHHMQSLSEKNNDFEVKLILGMTASEGISINNHNAFVKLKENEYVNRFECSYLYNAPSVHSKLYVWLENNEPIQAFIGSANYSQSAFFTAGREILSECSPDNALKYFNNIESRSIYCDSYDIDQHVLITKYSTNPDEDEKEENLNEQESIKVSLLASNGSMHKVAGLNWGQRKGRDKNQAYIPLKAEVYKTNFFPPKKIHFTVLTDDEKILICTRAQEKYGKAIETPHNNSLLGEYFRFRLGLANGQFVNKQDLLNYGRTDVTFYKIDEETFYMDFSI